VEEFGGVYGQQLQIASLNKAKLSDIQLKILKIQSQLSS
jgi:hypothetical protein